VEHRELFLEAVDLFLAAASHVHAVTIAVSPASSARSWASPRTVAENQLDRVAKEVEDVIDPADWLTQGDKECRFNG